MIADATLRAAVVEPREVLEKLKLVDLRITRKCDNVMHVHTSNGRTGDQEGCPTELGRNV